MDDLYSLTNEECFNVRAILKGILSLDDPVDCNDENSPTLVEILEDKNNSIYLYKLKSRLISLARNKKEIKIIELLAQGYSKIEIARTFKISITNLGKTVFGFVKRIPKDTQQFLLRQEYRKGIY